MGLVKVIGLQLTSIVVILFMSSTYASDCTALCPHKIADVGWKASECPAETSTDKATPIKKCGEDTDVNIDCSPCFPAASPTSFSSSCIESKCCSAGVECNCGRAVAKSMGFQPITKTGITHVVDPFIIPPKGRCNQMPVDAKGSFLPMDFGEYPTINANCDERIKFVMRAVPSQQPLGVYMPIFTGDSNEVSAHSLKPCMPAIKAQASEREKCDVRLSSTDKALVDTECQGYKTLYPMLLFGPLEGVGVVPGGLGGTLMKEYITDPLSSLVAPGKAEETLVFTCPWTNSSQSPWASQSSCMMGMFVRVQVTGCKVIHGCLCRLAPPGQPCRCTKADLIVRH